MKNILNIIFLSFVFTVIQSSPYLAHADASTAVDSEEVNQQITNDEGYGKEDAEYYSSENDNETIVEDEAPTTIDDEAAKDEDLTDVNEEVGLDDDMHVDGDTK